MEYLPFFSAAQIQGSESGAACLSLPSGTDHDQELFRGLWRRHTSAAAVSGAVLVTQQNKGQLQSSMHSVMHTHTCMGLMTMLKVL